MRLPLLRPLAAAAFLAAALTPAAGQTAAFSETQKQAIGEIVREYLLKNPELLQDVMAELEKRQAEAQRAAQTDAIRQSRQALVNSPQAIVAGNPGGDITLVEFFDYNCGYCKRALSDVQALVKSDPKLRVVLKDFPVLGPDSVEASRVSLAVKNQFQGQKLFDYHVRVMESRGRVNGDRAIAVAKEMGADMARLQRDMDAGEVKTALATNVELGDKLGLSGTPAFIIGDEVIPGAVGIEPLRQVIGNVRKCGKANC